MEEVTFQGCLSLGMEKLRGSGVIRQAAVHGEPEHKSATALHLSQKKFVVIICDFYKK
jgi:hypothetical protein